MMLHMMFNDVDHVDSAIATWLVMCEVLIDNAVFSMTQSVLVLPLL